MFHSSKSSETTSWIYKKFCLLRYYVRHFQLTGRPAPRVNTHYKPFDKYGFDYHVAGARSGSILAIKTGIIGTIETPRLIIEAS